MGRRLARFLPVTLAAALTMGAAADEPRWVIQYFHDEDDSELEIVDLQFPSPRHGIAVGTIAESRRRRHVAVVTSDGGRTWSEVSVKERPVSVFFLDESRGWMVTEGGLWQTEESGRSWRKVKAPSGILRVYFLNAERGWAMGLKKSLHRTDDGGRTWSPVPEAAETSGKPEHSAYTWMSFVTPRVGLVVGTSRPPRRDRLWIPDWIDPEAAMRRREWPGTLLLLTTNNGGKSWEPSQASVFGEVTRLRLLGDGQGLGLMEFRDAFIVPSEIMRIDLRTGRSSTSYRQRDRAVTDIALLPGGVAYAAAIERPGGIRVSAIPGKLRILHSNTDLNAWSEMQVDYRAFGHRAILADAGSGNVWVATDTGMILMLVLPGQGR
ncbi:MAG: WD40/YVTN/BNR-like repeat-containing protein [Bryobacteraceae bacterium]